MKALIDGDAISYIIGYASETVGYQYKTKFNIEIKKPESSFDLNTNDPAVTEDNGWFTFEFLNMNEKQVKAKLIEMGYQPDDAYLSKKIYVASEEHSKYLVNLLINQTLEDVGTQEFQVYLTSDDKSNFRFKLATTQKYKGNRKETRKPQNLSTIREYLINHYHAEIVHNMEADDALGIAQYTGKDTVICDNDKDTWMIPGDHYNIKTRKRFMTSDPGHLELVNNRRKLEGGGLLWFYAQMLLGDSADNIPGLIGYGPVKVFNLLKDVNNELRMLQIVRDEYILNKCEDRLVEVGGLLWILRTPTDQKGQHIQQMLGQLT